MKAIAVLFLAALVISTLLVCTIGAQDGGTFYSSPQESPLPLVKIGERELIYIERSVYDGDWSPVPENGIDINR